MLIILLTLVLLICAKDSLDLTITWVIIIVLSLISLFFIIGNGWIFYKAWIKKEHSPSVTPFLGGLFGGADVLLIPDNPYWFLCLFPMILDYGCIPTIVLFVITFIRDISEHSDR